jgi:DNA-binding PadR family transcriptional regulator
VVATPLQHLVMHKLSEQPHTGYSLSKELQASIGQRPSFGSIYPLLDRLRSDGLVTVKKEGRRKIYTLTESGRHKAQEVRQQKEHLIDDMTSNCRMMFELIGQDPQPLISMLQSMKKGKDPLGPVKVSMFRFRDLVFTMAHDGRLQRNSKRINEIIQRAHKDLEKLT